METRQLGNIEVSPIGMGCMAFSHGYGESLENAYVPSDRTGHQKDPGGQPLTSSPWGHNAK